MDPLIEQRIFVYRGQQVMLDRDLAELYGVSTKVFKQAVRRNIERFPADFMFEISVDELEVLFEHSRSQVVTLKRGLNEKYGAFLFTEQGVAMLSSVLRSPMAIQIHIQIMRSFVRLRQMVASHQELRLKLEAMEQRYDAQFKTVFDAMRRLIAMEEDEKPEIGF